jgi:hypothetical protein
MEKRAKATKKRGKRNVKVGKLPRAKKQLGAGEMKAVEGAGPLADFASGVAHAIENTAAGVAHVVGEGAQAVSDAAKQVEKAIKG